MYKTPLSLQKCCANFICDNLGVLCETQSRAVNDLGQATLVFEDTERQFNAALSELLISSLNKHGRLNDKTLSLMHPKIAALHHVIIHKSPVTCQGLGILQGHRVVHLEVTESENVTVSDIIGCLGEWSLSNLQILNLSGMNTSADSQGGIVTISKLKTLHTLNVSFTDFNEEGLQIIAETLSSLKVLDISCTSVCDISVLRKLHCSLRSLSMYGLQFKKHSDPVGVVCMMALLNHLDVSNYKNSLHRTTMFFPVDKYLLKCEANPNLVSLDLSGAKEVAPHVLESFLDVHPSLEFLGLALTPMSRYDMFQLDNAQYRSHSEFKISGDFTASHLMESLRRYLPRIPFVCEALEMVEILSHEEIEESREEMIELILQAMKRHIMAPSVQWLALACLAKFTRDSNDQLLVNIHPTLLSECVDLAVTALENCPLPRQIQRFSERIIINKYILENVNFDWARCLKAFMKCWPQGLPRTDPQSLNICIMLLRKVVSQDLSTILPDRQTRRILLQVLQIELSRPQDDLFQHWLDILWCLTDECVTFAAEGGVELIMKVVEKNARGLGNKCLAVLDNIVEDVTARQMLLKGDLITLLRQKIRTSSLTVNFLSAYVLAHLCRESEEMWTSHKCRSKTEVLEDLMAVVLKWKGTSILYTEPRSFTGFYSLLECKEMAVQRFGVWAIHGYCSTYGGQYLRRLHSDGGHKHIQRLKASRNIDSRVKLLCGVILEMVEDHTGSPLPKLARMSPSTSSGAN